MIATAHLAMGAGVGALVARKMPDLGIVRQALVVLVSGAISHLILDATPHGEYPKTLDDFLRVIVVAESLLVLFLVFSKRNSRALNFLIFTGMSGGAMPDLIWMVGRAVSYQWLIDLSNFIHFFHAKHDSWIEINAGWQFIISLVFLVYFYRKVTSRPSAQ